MWGMGGRCVRVCVRVLVSQPHRCALAGVSSPRHTCHRVLFALRLTILDNLAAAYYYQGHPPVCFTAILNKHVAKPSTFNLPKPNISISIHPSIICLFLSNYFPLFSLLPFIFTYFLFSILWYVYLSIFYLFIMILEIFGRKFKGCS